MGAEFCRGLSNRSRLSKKQREILDRLCQEYLTEDAVTKADEAMNNADAAIVDLFECIVISAQMNGSDELPVTADDFGEDENLPNRIIFERLIALTNAVSSPPSTRWTQRELERVGGAGRITEISICRMMRTI